MKKILSLIAIFGLVLLSVPQVRAADGVNSAASTASVTNVVPVSSAVDITLAAIDLTEATHTHVAVTATVTDNNSCEEITGVTAKLFRTNVADGAACTTNLNNCYAPVAMTIVDSGNTCTAGGTDLSADYTASIEVQFYADATDTGAYEATTWSVHVIPSDAGGAGTAGTDNTAEMNTLTALNVTANIAYGELALGEDTDTDNETTTVSNTGNVDIDSELKSGAATTAMTCDPLGSIPVANEKFGLTTGDWDGLTSLVGSTTHVNAGMDIHKTTDGTPLTDIIYWGLGMPANGVAGNCSGTVVFTAVVTPV